MSVDASSGPTGATAGKVFRPSHTGLCVSDLDRSLRFYRDGLGFELGERFHLTRTIAEVDPPVDVTAQFIRLEGLVLELLWFASPGPIGQPSHRRNHLGLTHLSFHVDDVDARALDLEALGGTILHDTRHGGAEQILFVADPDGTRVELMSIPPGHPYWG
jgi:glyoxylase I family protein